MPKVSIILPCYNHAPYLQQRLSSIYNQSYRDFEVIILDDCSSDNSIEILNQFKEHPQTSHFVVNTVNSGSAIAQWRKGIALARGEYIWIAESDDYAEVAFLDELVPLIDSDNEISLIYCQSSVVDKNSHVQRLNTSWTDNLDEQRWLHNHSNDGNNEILKYLLFQNTIPNASAVITRSAILKNAIRPIRNYGLSYCADWLLWIRVIALHKIYYCAKPLNYFREHNSSVRVSAIHNGIAIKERLAVLQYITDNFAVDNTAITRAARNFFDIWQTILHQKSSNITLLMNMKIAFCFNKFLPARRTDAGKLVLSYLLRHV